MTEISFAKSFLATLNTYPTKISSDHVENPKNYSLRSTYTLPKHTKPLPFVKSKPNSTTSSTTITVHLKSQRNPPLDYSLSSLQKNTTILEIKNMISQKLDVSAEKIKILYNKKPVGDSKQLKDFIAAATSETNSAQVGPEEVVDLGVMILGGTSAAKAETAEIA